MIIKGIIFIALAYIVAYTIHKIYCSYKGIPHTQVRLNLEEEDDYTMRYKVQVKFFNLIWTTVDSGNINNSFRKEETDVVKKKLKSGEYYIKNMMLYEKTDEGEEFLI